MIKDISTAGNATEASVALDFLRHIYEQQAQLQAIEKENIEKSLGESLTIEVDGKNRIVLNAALLRRQGVDADGIRAIKALHVLRLLNIDIMEELDPLIHDERAQLRDLAVQNGQIEYKLQDAWGFPRDDSFHYWYDLPHCKCPKLDNRDAKGSKRRIISVDCPLHGDVILTSNAD